MKKIITRVLIAIVIAFILSKLKLLGIINVSALEVWNSSAADFCTYTTSNTQCDTNLNNWNRFGQTYKTYTYFGTINFESVSYFFQLPNNKNKEYYVNGVFQFYGGNTGESSFPVRAWVTDTNNTSTCHVEGSYFNQEVGYANSYIFSCKVFQGNANGIRIVFGGPFANYDSTYAISTISTVYDRDELIALQTQNEHLQQIRNSINQTNTKLDNIKDILEQQKQQQQQTNNKIQEQNDFLKDSSSVDNSSITNITNTNTNTSNTPVSDLIILPLNLLNAYKNGMNNSCSPVNLGSLLGTNLTIPCINLRNYFGDDLWSIIDVLMSLFMAYNIGMLCITIWEGITSLHDDFYGAYQPQHGVGGRVQAGEMEGLY